jgi:hypothetical protein
MNLEQINQHNPIFKYRNHHRFNLEPLQHLAQWLTRSDADRSAQARKVLL